jgi:hypothetical protein
MLTITDIKHAQVLVERLLLSTPDEHLSKFSNELDGLSQFTQDVFEHFAGEPQPLHDYPKINCNIPSCSL